MKYPFLKSVAVLTVLTLTACSSVELIENKDEEGNVIEKYYRDKETFAKDGLYQSFNSTGQLLSEATYKNDQLNGTQIFYYESGAVEIKENYLNGNYEGSYEVFFEDGSIKQTGKYTANEATGEWKTYYANGQLKETVILKNNEEHGPFKEYAENGNLIAEGIYKGADVDTGNPKEHGELKIYDPETGELLKRMDCKYGVCKTVWKKEGYEEYPDEENDDI